MNTTLIINRYQLSFMRKSLVILTFVMVGVVLLSLILGLVMQETISFMSLEISTAISVFVGGLNSFKECFGFSLQNAASRKNVYLGTLLAGVGTALAFAVMESSFWVCSRRVCCKSSRRFRRVFWRRV